jgi:hypothetical protein
MNRKPWTTGALVASLCLAAHAQERQDLYSLKIVKGVQGPDAGKAAEVFANSAGGRSSTVLNGAVLLRDVSLPGIPGRLDNAWGASVGLSKNTLSTKRSDMLTLGTGIYSRWAVFPERGDMPHLQHTLDSSLDLFLEHDRENRARSRALAWDLAWRGPLLFDPQLDPGDMGVSINVVPSMGLYHRRISSTRDATAAPLGSHGGPYVAARLTLRWLWSFPTPRTPLFDRVSMDMVVRHTRDTVASGGYAKASYRFAEVTLDYLLTDQPIAKGGFKPSVFVSRTVGTDRPANGPRQYKSSVGFKMSYGI